MSSEISIKKLKKIMYRCLRWRLQVPEYYPHNKIPKDSELSEFSRGVKCAYKDLLREIEKIEESGNQRNVWNRISEHLFKEDYVDEMRWKKEE